MVQEHLQWDARTKMRVINYRCVTDHKFLGWTILLVSCKSNENCHPMKVTCHGYLFTGLDYWTGLPDCTTGLTQTALKCLSQCRAEAKHAYSLKLLC